MKLQIEKKSFTEATATTAKHKTTKTWLRLAHSTNETMVLFRRPNHTEIPPLFLLVQGLATPTVGLQRFIMGVCHYLLPLFPPARCKLKYQEIIHNMYTKPTKFTLYLK